MKPRIQSLTLTTLFLLGTALLGGCATTGMDRSVKTSTSIQEVDHEIRTLMVRIDATGASLDALVGPGQTDLKKSFDIYSDSVAQLEKEGKRVLKRIEEMKFRSKEYFAEWEREGDGFTNPQIRELSEQRRSRLAEIYAQVPASSVGVQAAYLAYLSDLKEIQKFLSNDLTPKGIDAIEPVAKKTVLDSDDLKNSLRPVVSALDEINKELYSSAKK